MKVAIMGYGTIGSGVAEVLEVNRDVIEKRCREPLELKYVLDLRNFEGDPIADKVVHDYKIRHFDSRQKALPFHPDYYARKFEIFSEADDVWIHYLSHELEGLTAEEFRREYSGRYPELKSIGEKGLFR